MTDKVEFQRRGPKQFRLFTDQCCHILEDIGFSLSKEDGQFPDLGINVCTAAKNKAGKQFLFLFRGSWAGTQPGLLRTDTTKKALYNAYALAAEKVGIPFVIMTSHDVSARSGSSKMIAAARRHGVLHDVIVTTNTKDIERLNLMAG
jgi:hypothetical protein